MPKFFRYCLALLLVGCGLNQEEVAQRNDYLYNAQKYYRGQKYYNTLQQVEKALEIDPDFKDVLILKAWTFFFMNRHEEAQAIFEQILRKDDSEPWAHYGMGAIAFKNSSKTDRKLAEVEQRFLTATDKEKSALEADRQRFLAEQQIWYDNSIEHFESALRVAPDNYDLYKMIAAVHGARGSQYYPKAIPYLDRLIKHKDEEFAALTSDVTAHTQERVKPGLPQTEREKLDLMVDSIRRQIEQNRKEYRIAQGMAGEMEFRLAYIAAQQGKETMDGEERQKYEEESRSFAMSAKQRVQQMLATSPDLANQYRNLALIAKFEGNDDEAAKYLQEYLQHNTLGEPKARADAKIELERLQQPPNAKSEE